MTGLDMAVLVIILLAIGLVASLYYAWTEHCRAQGQQRRAEELSCWAEAYQLDLVAAEQKNQQLRQRNATLVELHALRVRQLLAANYRIIAETVVWRQGGNEQRD